MEFYQNSREVGFKKPHKKKKSMKCRAILLIRDFQITA